MRITDSVLNQFGFHDTLIDKIEVRNNEITLFFEEGIYRINGGKEIEKTNNCKANLKICNYNEPLDNFVDIISLKRKKAKEITLTCLIDMLNKNKFDIIDSYLSDFSQSILIFGYIGKLRISLSISGIEESEIIFKKPKK